jgi:hypothetical protein
MMFFSLGGGTFYFFFHLVKNYIQTLLRRHCRGRYLVEVVVAGESEVGGAFARVIGGKILATSADGDGAGDSGGGPGDGANSGDAGFSVFATSAVLLLS